MKNIRIAAVISNSPVNQIDTNLNRMLHWVKQSKEQGVQMICFPELNICGYGIRPGGITAEPVPGPVSRFLQDLAVKEEMVILAGMAEKGADSRVYASHLVAQPDGSVGIYRKLHIAPPEREVFSAGNNVPLFDALGVRFGIQLCYDSHFPELSTLMTAQGAELIFMPHASPHKTPAEKYDTWKRHLPARAYDNSLFIVACNQQGDNGSGLGFPGLAMVIGPSGEILQKDLSGKEGMLIADLRAGDLNHVRNHKMRFFFPNRRPELYSSIP